MISCDSLGWVGGYLIVNAQGRPLEFHCTVPVAPNRAQEILYGVTFAPFFFGELIGQALLKRSKTPPQLVITNHAQVLAAREFHAVPLVYLPAPGTTDSGQQFPGKTTTADERELGADQGAMSTDPQVVATESSAPLHTSSTGLSVGFPRETAGEVRESAELADQPSADILKLPLATTTADLLPFLAAHPDFLADRELAGELLGGLPTSWTLTEPFERIEQAVREAQRAA